MPDACAHLQGDDEHPPGASDDDHPPGEEPAPGEEAPAQPAPAAEAAATEDYSEAWQAYWAQQAQHAAPTGEALPGEERLEDASIPGPPSEAPPPPSEPPKPTPMVVKVGPESPRGMVL